MRTRLGLAALALLAVSCSENENMGTPEVQVNAKAIRIGQSVQGMTRAVVADGSDVTATVLMCDGESATWTSFAAVNSNTITSEGVLSKRANTGTASFKAGANTTVSLNPTLYYDNTAAKLKSHLAAVAPAGKLSASGTVVTMNDVDGQQDVMYAEAVNAGSEASKEVTINLSFKHLTTQLNFDVKMTGVDGGDWDNKTVTIKSIKVQSAELPQSVNAADGTVTWSAASPLTVPGINYPVLSETVSKTGNPVMIKAGSLVKLDVTLTIGGKDLVFSNVPIKNNGSELTTVTGNSHLVSLNVTEPKTASGSGVAIIDVTATVAPWVVGTPGSGELN